MFMIKLVSLAENCLLKCDHEGTVDMHSCSCNCPGEWTGLKCGMSDTIFYTSSFSILLLNLPSRP